MNIIIICLLLCITTVFGSQSELTNFSDHLNIEIATNEKLLIKVNFDGLTDTSPDFEQDFSFSGVGMITTPGLPALPTYSSWVLVPPGKRIELIISDESARTVRAVNPPSLNPVTMQKDESTEWDGEQIFPSAPVVVSKTARFRQYNLAQVTYYPVQYDPQTGNYITRSDIDVEINFVDDENWIQNNSNFRRTPSPDIQTMLESMVINPPPHRDDQELILERGYRDYVFIMIPELHQDDFEDEDDFARIADLVQRLIKWKQQAGDKVELFTIPYGDSVDDDMVKAYIQNSYGELLEMGIEPFDNILLIGEEDRELFGNNAGGMGQDILLWAPIGDNEEDRWIGHFDMSYTYLEHEGDEEDYIPDVALSRIHAGNLPMLANGINKTLSYESEPYIENDSWFTKSVVAQEPLEGLGLPTVYPTVDYFIQTLEHNDKHVIAEFRPDDGDDSGTWIIDQMNEGLGFMAGRATNRGLAYHNGRGQDDNLDSNFAFPIAIFTSGHGEWAMESLFWVGREFYEENRDRYNDLEGAKGAVATTCSWMGPETVKANTCGSGMLHAMLDLRLSFGWARNWMLMNLARTFPGDQNVLIWYSNNFTLCGDVSIRAWEGVPKQIVVDYPESIPEGSSYIPVSVTDQAGSPMPGIMLTLLGWDEDELDLSEIAFTDANGKHVFIIDPDYNGTLKLTATGQDIYPHKGEIVRVDPDGFLDAALVSIDDEAGGNGDGEVNPGEQVNITFSVTNPAANGDADTVRAWLTSTNRYVEIVNNRLEFGNMAAGQTVESQDPAIIRISPDCPDNENLDLILNITSTNGLSAIDAFRLDPFGAYLEVFNLPIGGIEGGDVELELELRNIGRIATAAMTATLISESWAIEVTRETASYDAIEADSTNAPAEGFLLSSHDNFIPGMRVPMTLLLESDGLPVGKINFELQIESADSSSDPFGPDSYGYYVFDDSDEDFDSLPSIDDWVEISTYADNQLPGVPLDITRGDRNDGWGVVELPFTFRYYGVDYNWITVCTNGFIAMGADQFAVPNMLNWSLEGGGVGGPYGMIAPFWDNIYIQNREAGIFTIYDDLYDVFIIEWYQMRHHDSEIYLTFQILLYNTATTPTFSMDGQIDLLYSTINQRQGNQDSNTPQASVGIANGEANAGISYTTAGVYPPTSAVLGNQRAIRFTTTPHYMTGSLSGRVTDSYGNGISQVAVSTSHGGIDTTEANGRWTLEDVFAETEISVYFEKAGHYTAEKKKLTVPEGGEIELNITLSGSSIIINPEDLHSYLEINSLRTRPLAIDNRDGTEAIHWSVEKYLPDGDNPEPWTQRIQVNLTEALEAQNINGIAFAEDQFFVTGLTSEDESVIYRLNANLGLIGSFDQPGNGDSLMTDLAWDGEFLWGARNDTAYQFTTEGNVESLFELSITGVKTITWDPIEELLWMSGEDEYIHGLDIEGNEQKRIFVNGLRITGLAFQPNQNDGYSVIAYNHRTEVRGQYRQLVHRINTDTGDIRLVKSLSAHFGPGTDGAFLTSEYELDSWVFAILSTLDINDENRVILELYQLSDNIDWFNLSHNSGVTEAGQISIVDAHFDSEMLERGEYEAGILVDVDILAEPVEVVVTMHVVAAHPPIDYNLTFPLNNAHTDSNAVTFKWEDTYDPNAGDEVSYIFWVLFGADSTFFLTDADSLRYDPVDQFDLDIGDRIIWWTQAVAGGDTIECNDRFTLIYGPNDIGDEPGNLPVEFGLQTIYPNPFNSTTSIKVGIESSGLTKLIVYDISGREVIRLSDGTLAAGNHTFSVNAQNMASGMYIVRLEQGAKIATRKMILIR